MLAGTYAPWTLSPASEFQSQSFPRKRHLQAATALGPSVISVILGGEQENATGLKLQMLTATVSLHLWYLFLRTLLLKPQNHRQRPMTQDTRQRPDNRCFWAHGAPAVLPHWFWSLLGCSLTPHSPCASPHCKNNHIHQADGKRSTQTF